MAQHALLDRPPGSTVLCVSRAMLDKQPSQIHDCAPANIPADTVYAAAVISGDAHQVYSASKCIAHMDGVGVEMGP